MLIYFMAGRSFSGTTTNDKRLMFLASYYVLNIWYKLKPAMKKRQDMAQEKNWRDIYHSKTILRAHFNFMSSLIFLMASTLISVVAVPWLKH